MLKSIFSIAAVAAMLGATCADDAKAPKLEGTYTIVSGERGGKPLPPEHFTGSVVIFTVDKVVGTDKEKKQLFSATYVLDAKAKPMVIKMKATPPAQAPNDPPKDTPETPGLIEFDGDNVKIIYAMPGGTAPTEFKTKENQDMFILQRVKVQ